MLHLNDRYIKSGLVVSSCPGEIQCSGHGLCTTSTNRCACDLGWESGDCGELSCPLGLSWSVTHLAYHNHNRKHNCSSYPVSPKSHSISSLNSCHDTQLLITLLYLSICLPVCICLCLSLRQITLLHSLALFCSLSGLTIHLATMWRTRLSPLVRTWVSATPPPVSPIIW